MESIEHGLYHHKVKLQGDFKTAAANAVTQIMMEKEAQFAQRERGAQDEIARARDVFDAELNGERSKLRPILDELEDLKKANSSMKYDFPHELHKRDQQSNARLERQAAEANEAMRRLIEDNASLVQRITNETK